MHARIAVAMIIRDGKHYFTLSEANRLVPNLQTAFGKIRLFRGELSALTKELEAAGLSDPDAIFSSHIELPPQLHQTRARVQELVELINDEVIRLQDTGCIVKNIENGIVDFYSRREGKDIFLCWQYGESDIRFWHGTTDGFAGRRPIEDVRPSKNNAN